MTTPRSLPPVAQFTLEKFDAMITVVDSLSDAQANYGPDLPGSNTVYALMTHVMGMARAWSSTNNLGVPVDRDRDAEFVASGDVAELVSRAKDVRDALAADFAATDFGGAPISPRPGRDEWWAQTTEGVVLHIFEEVCQHLGHMEITADLARKHAN